MATDVMTEGIASPPRAEAPLGRLFRISLERYEAMAEHGLLRPSDRVILLDGLLVTTMTKGSRHSTLTQMGQRAVEAVLPAGWHVRKEDPILLPDVADGDSAPEPDLAVVAGELGTYMERHPGPAEIGLLVEFADSSVAEDRAGLWRYARAGIPAVWLVNIPGRVVEVYTQPTGPTANPGYRTCEVKKPGEPLGFALGAAGPIGPIAAERLLP